MYNLIKTSFLCRDFGFETKPPKEETDLDEANKKIKELTKELEKQKDLKNKAEKNLKIAKDDAKYLSNRLFECKHFYDRSPFSFGYESPFRTFRDNFLFDRYFNFFDTPSVNVYHHYDYGTRPGFFSRFWHRNDYNDDFIDDVFDEPEEKEKKPTIGNWGPFINNNVIRTESSDDDDSDFFEDDQY